MATKKKELLEQENTAPETTVTVENAPPPDEAQADMAAPADGGDLNELLASMDQPDEEAATIEDDGSLPELTESEMFGEMDTDATAADALPGDDDAALTEGPDSDDGEGASAVPADDGAADVPSEPVSGAAEEPEPPGEIRRVEQHRLPLLRQHGGDARQVFPSIRRHTDVLVGGQEIHVVDKRAGFHLLPEEFDDQALLALFAGTESHQVFLADNVLRQPEQLVDKHLARVLHLLEGVPSLPVVPLPDFRLHPPGAQAHAQQEHQQAARQQEQQLPEYTDIPAYFHAPLSHSPPHTAPRRFRPGACGRRLPLSTKSERIPLRSRIFAAISTIIA